MSASSGPGRWYFTEGITGISVPLPGRNAIADQLQIVGKRMPPAAAAPGDGPAFGAVAGLLMGSATIRDSLIAQAAIDCRPELSWAMTVFKTLNPRPASAASSSWAWLSVSCPDALPQGLCTGSRCTSRHVQAVASAKVVVEITGKARRANRAWSAAILESQLLRHGRKSGQKMRPDDVHAPGSGSALIALSKWFRKSSSASNSEADRGGPQGS